MTEAEWLSESDPMRMLHFLGHRPRWRKLRLFAVSSFRRVPELHGEKCERLLEAIERSADGDGQTIEDDKELFRRLEESYFLGAEPGAQPTLSTGFLRPTTAADETSWSMPACSWATQLNRTHRPEHRFGKPEEVPKQVALLRDIFGNPFRPITLAPSWLTSTVLSLATGTYKEKAFDRLPILADALQDAGCDNADVLDHLRGPGPHAKGCWALDLVLGKA